MGVFETTQQNESRRWHHRTDRQEERPSARLPKEPPVPSNESPYRPLGKNIHVPYNFDPTKVTGEAYHTPIFATSQFRRNLRPCASDPRLQTEGKIHRQGHGDTFCNPAWLVGIPGYTGHIQGKVPENEFSRRFMLANEFAQCRVQLRKPTVIGDYYHNTLKAHSEEDPPRIEWTRTAHQRWGNATHGMTHQLHEPWGHGDEYRQRMQEAEQLKNDHIEHVARRAKTTVRTWAANQPHHIRDHNLWRVGIRGYTGHKPKWNAEKDFFDKREVGKVHPPYYPEITLYSCIAQPPETPRPDRPEVARAQNAASKAGKK